MFHFLGPVGGKPNPIVFPKTQEENMNALEESIAERDSAQEENSDFDPISESEVDSSAEEEALMEQESETLLQDAQRNFQVQLAKHKVRKRSNVKKSAQQKAELMEMVDSHLMESRADSTWGGYASVFGQFQNFDHAQNLLCWKTTSMATKILFFITHKLDAQEISVQSAYAVYLRKLKFLYRRSRLMTAPGLEVLADFQKSLVRKGAMNPMDAAPPATPEEVARVLRNCRTAGAYFQIALMWMTASRVSDMLRLTKRDLQLMKTDDGRSILELRWMCRTKGSYSTTYDRVLIVHELERYLLEYLGQKTEDEFPFVLGARAVTALLRRVNPNLSSHSLKKGALTLLMMQRFPIDMLSEKAKHRDVKLLRAYVDPGVWAQSRQPLEMSISLLGSLKAVEMRNEPERNRRCTIS